SAPYYTKAGFKMTTKRINSTKTTAIHAFENVITTNRTAMMNKINEYIDTALTAFNALTTFYDEPDIQGRKFLNYQG
ncbi:hypothetical protein DFQ29_000265, partial [Apophysomyces sp. BC1021]